MTRKVPRVEVWDMISPSPRNARSPSPGSRIDRWVDSQSTRIENRRDSLMLGRDLAGWAGNWQFLASRSRRRRRPRMLPGGIFDPNTLKLDQTFGQIPDIRLVIHASIAPGRIG